MAFQLDTSGSVLLTLPPNDVFKHIFWTDLDAFTQGYVEALLRSLVADIQATVHWSATDIHAACRFDRIAPATLARIMADCKRYTKGCDWPLIANDGRTYWALRQAGRLVNYPPLTPYLGDDGLIYLRDGLPVTSAQTTAKPSGMPSSNQGAPE